MTFKGTREAVVAALTELTMINNRIQIISPDSMKAARATSYAAQFPNNFVEVGISEQAAVDIAAGMAASGLIPFVMTYCGFITMRALEQVRTFVAYPELNVKMVGFNAGMHGGEREGVTHQFYEDIGILRSIPNVTIVCPSDDISAYFATKAIAAVDGPCYLRIGSGREQRISDDTFPDFELGKIRILKDFGCDIAIFTHGFVTDKAIAAVDLLKENGINAKLVEVHTIRPLDVCGISEVLNECKNAITFEDHNINGGLGSAIAELIAEGASAKLIRLGLKDTFAESGTPGDLLCKYETDTIDILNAAQKLLK